jgi:hypothetical protein
MAKGRDKQGREKKKKKKVKVPGGAPAAGIEFRHHSVVTTPPEVSSGPSEQKPF